MNSWSVTWTVLPNGFADSGRARLSLVPTLRVCTDSGRLGDSRMYRWPTLIAGLRGLQLQAGDTDRPIEATVTSDAPRQELWDALFAESTPVDVEPTLPEPPIFVATETALHYGPALEAVRRVYDEAAALGTDGVLPPDSPALSAVRGLASWSFGGASGARVAALPADIQQRLDDLLAPATRTSDGLAEAAELLRGAGQTDAAAALPLALVQQRLRWSGARASAKSVDPVPPQPSHVGGIKSVDQADFHQVTGLIGDHPALALAVGLRVDVEIDAFEGDRLLRLLATDEPPLQGDDVVKQPWSAVTCEPDRRRFVMRSDPALSAKAGEVRHGMLDLSSGPTSRYVIGTTDVYAAAQQLQALAGIVTSSEPPSEVALPPRRNGGLVVAQIDRKTGVFDTAMSKGESLHQAWVSKADDVVLFADDVTSGYRVDVAADDGPFRSVMRRQISYRVGAELGVSATDEGVVEPMTLAEQYDDDGVPHLLLGEELFGWDGASLAAPAPGRRVAGEPGRPPVEDVEPALAPGYPLDMAVVAEPGTLPRLRYGRSYRVQARTVDLAGNSIAPEDGEPALASDPVPYRRVDPVLAPTLAPRTAFSLGESRNRMVVRSDGAGRTIGRPCERHLLAPKATQRMAEGHGMFDAAFGPRATPADRDRALAIARNEAGHLTDAVVPDPLDPAARIPQPGIAVVVNDGAAAPPSAVLPLKPGAQLPAGEYIALDADDPHLPWLADPTAQGACVSGVPDASGVPSKKNIATAAYGARGDWPDVRPARLVTVAGPQAATAVRSGADGRGIVEVTVPPAAELRLQVSSTLRPERLDSFDLPPGTSREAAEQGRVPMLSPRDDLVVVHAVSTPLPPLALQAALSGERQVGSTTASLFGDVVCHPGSTVRVDVEAVWQEPVDNLVDDFRLERRSSTAQHIPVDEDQDTLVWASTLTLGDTRRRDITVVPVGSSRYREYFDPADLRTRTGDGQTVIVPNAARPSPPRVHSVLPTFRWSRQMHDSGVWTSMRETAGVRVWLRRPWMQTGVGERLGVVLFASDAVGTAAIDGKKRLAELATRFYADPLRASAAITPLDGTTVGNPAEPALPRPLVEAGVGPADAVIAGVEVHFDTERKLWYADVDFSNLQLPTNIWPFVRLGLVRYQPESVAGCHVSRVVTTELVQIPGFRQLTVRPTSDQLTLQIEIRGGFDRQDYEYSATLTPRVPNQGGLSVVQQLNTAVGELEVALTDIPQDPGSSVMRQGLFTIGGDPSDRDLVVREKLMGDYLHADQRVPVTTWFDLVPGHVLLELIGMAPRTPAPTPSRSRI